MAGRIPAAAPCRTTLAPLPIANARLCPAPKPLAPGGKTARPRLVAPRALRDKGEDSSAREFFFGEDSAGVTYCESLVRTFLLGLCTGTFVEVCHVVYKFSGLLKEVGMEQVMEVFPRVVDRFSPLFYVDHMAAVSAWGVLYVLEVAAVMSLLQQNPGKEDYTEDIEALRPLSKVLIPLNLKASLIKHLMFRKPEASAVASSSLNGTSPTAPAMLQPAKFVDSEPVLDKPGSKKLTQVVSIPEVGNKDAATREHQVQWRQKELRERQSFLKHFWYAAALSDNVTDKPFGVEVLGMKLVLFRGKDQTVKCLRDSCPHRSAPLSDGWTESIQGHDCVVCPYHGWAIDELGCIKNVPAAEGKNTWPQSPHVDSFIVEEKGGFIWLFYEGHDGEHLPADERPPIPCIPELDDPEWIPSYGELEFECGHWAVFENAIDMAHIHYLHKDSFGNEGKPVVMNMTGTSGAYGVTTTFDIHNKPVSPLWNFTAVESVPVVAKALLPSTSMIKITLGAGIEFITFVCTVPISKDRCVNRFALLRNFLPWPTNVLDPWAQRAMYKILGEDKVMVESLRPEETLREVSVRADLPQLLFRKLRQEYMDMGYGCFPDAN